VSTDERIIGGRSVAAAVHDRGGVVMAAIQVAGTDESLQQARVSSLILTVRNAADTLSRRL
jgi:DNA-binding IclR family transcriptional regulator